MISLTKSVSLRIMLGELLLPSQGDLFFEDGGAQDRGDNHAERLERRHEHRAARLRHDPLHVEGHAGAHDPLEEYTAENN